MKKVCLAILLSAVCLFSKAQNYNALVIDYSTGKFDDAKKEVDKLLTEGKLKDKAETYLWKVKVYAEIYADSALTKKYTTAGTDALAALDVYVTKEPDLKLLKEDGSRAISLLYGISFNNGRSYFQASDWNNAFASFSFCQNVSEFIGKNGLSASGKYTIDTTVVLYTAYAAQNAGKQDDAVKRYKALADWKINDADYIDIYKFILNYETDKKNEAEFNKYLAIAREAHPKQLSLWNQFAMNYQTTNSSLMEIVAKYKADDAAGKLKEDDYVTFAESFASPDKAQQNALDSAQQVNLKMAAADAFAKAFNLNNAEGLYAFNTGVLYYSTFTTLDDRFYNYTGQSAELKAKRDAIVKEQQEIAAKAIEWLEKGYTVLKAKTDRNKAESNSLNRSVDYLANLFAWKREKSKGVNPKDFDAFDAKYKFYDGEHDKYKN